MLWNGSGGWEDRRGIQPQPPPGGSQMQLLRDESCRKPSGHTHVYPPCVFAHSPCWQRPRVAHSSTSARNAVSGLRGVRDELPAGPAHTAKPFPLLPPAPPPLTLAGPINPFKACWTRSIWGAHSARNPCGEREGWAGASGAKIDGRGQKRWEGLKDVKCGLSAV